MKVAERNKSENRIPEVHRKAWVIAAIGCGIGAGIGGYVSVLKGDYLYAGVGAGIGVVVGQLAGMLLTKKASLQTLDRTEARINWLVGSLSFLMCLAALYAFVSAGEGIALLGVLFFAAAGFYLVAKDRVGRHDLLLAIVSLIFVLVCISLMVIQKQITVIPMVGVVFFGIGFLFLLFKKKRI